MSELAINTGVRCPAEIEVPGDKSMSHRAVMLTALARGISQIGGFLPSEDCLATVGAMRSLGVTIRFLDDGRTRLRVEGRGMQLRAPGHAIDCGNSGTALRLLAGIVSGQPFVTELGGDASLSQRPMGRIIKPLASMGASIESRGEREGCAPLAIRGGDLRALRYELPVASAQVKTAVLFAGLFAEGETMVIQPSVTRDHTERMLKQFGVDVKTSPDGLAISLEGGQELRAGDFRVPGDISSAAFWLVAAAAQPGQSLTIRRVGLNPTRDAVVRVLERMGATISRENIFGQDGGEPIGDLVVTGAQLRGTVIEGSEIPNLIDEIPVVAVAGALAEGKTVIRDAAELRVKESDRINTVVENLRVLGVQVAERADGMEITGGLPLRGGRIDSFGDHRIAMAFAVAALFAEGETVIGDVDCIDTSYPGFNAALRSFQR